MTDLVTVAELGGPLAAIGGAAYLRHAHPAAYWSTVGLPVSMGADLRLRAWAHMLGFRGHFSTKSRRYSTTLGALRKARAEWRRAQAAPAMPEDGETTLVLAHWMFAGTGLRAAEAWLAASLEPDPGTEGEPTWTAAATN